MKKLPAVMSLLVVVAVLAAACGQPKADPASIARGGAMYDKWWKVAEGANEPTEDQPLWFLQSTNTRSGSTTWRCKECHGWDYRGRDGAYSSGSHYTGFPGVYGAGTTTTKDQLLQIMKGGNDARHDFSAVLGEEALQDIVSFLSEGLIDETRYIDYSTRKVVGADLTNGKQLFDGTCAACHGSNGRMLKFDDVKVVGTLANDNPWETLHKIRFGHPGTPMPRTLELGWSTQDVVDVLGYAQTLPEE